MLSETGHILRVVGEATFEFVNQRGLFNISPDYVFSQRTDWDRRVFNRAIKRAKERKCIHECKTGGKIVYRLTKAGEKQWLLDKLRYSQCESNGLYCIVIFDIPESMRRVRDTFRTILRRSGFRYHQRSAWYSTSANPHYVKKLVSNMKLSRYVTVLEGRKV